MRNNAEDGTERIWYRMELEREGEASTQAAWRLGKDEQRTIAQDVGAIALGKQVPDVEQRLKAARSVACDMNRLAEVNVEEGLSGAICKRSY